MNTIQTDKIVGTLIDVASIRDFKLSTYNKQNGKREIKGLLIILAINFFPCNKSFFSKDCDVEIALHDSNLIKGIICNNINFYNFGKNGEKIPMNFDFPMDYNIFINPLLKTEKNNIRIIPCLLECGSDIHPVLIQDLKEIKITLYGIDENKEVDIYWNNKNISKQNFICKYANER